MSTKDDRRGIHRHGTGWRASVSRGRALPPVRQAFALVTPFPVMQAWREDTRAALRVQRKSRATYGSFEGDVKRYLQAIQHQQKAGARAHELQMWIAEFGRRARSDIRTMEIQEAFDRWTLKSRSDVDPRPLAPATLNKRLRALSNVWTTLDGNRAPNPVRDVHELEEPEPQERALSYEVIEAIIRCMPDTGRGDKGKDRPTASKTKARVRVLAYSGLPPKQVAALARQDLDLDRGVVRVPRRKKGRGVAGDLLPLLPAGIDAFREFDSLNCWGPFSMSSLRKSFKSAAARAGFPSELRPYDLRHSFGTLFYDLSENKQLTARMLRHGDARTTERYVVGALHRVFLRQVGRVGEDFPALPAAAGRVEIRPRGPRRVG